MPISTSFNDLELWLRVVSEGGRLLESEFAKRRWVGQMGDACISGGGAC